MRKVLVICDKDGKSKNVGILPEPGLEEVVKERLNSLDLSSREGESLIVTLIHSVHDIATVLEIDELRY